MEAGVKGSAYKTNSSHVKYQENFGRIFEIQRTKKWQLNGHMGIK